MASSIAKRNPNTILLSRTKECAVIWDADHVDELETYQASDTITPGFLVEMHLNGTELNWRPSASATEQATPAIALERAENNWTIDTDYAAGDTVRVAWLRPGAITYSLIPSGQDIARGDYLQSNGDGYFKEATATTATANVARWQSLDSPGSVTADTRLRVVYLG